MLKDGTSPEDPRLDRLVSFDDRSRNFAVMAVIPTAAVPRSYSWRANPRFDQGQDGACVGFGIGAELAARPAEVLGLTNTFLKETLYWEAQKIDPWEGGSYPGASPFYEGTSVLAGVKVAQRLGYFDSYHWSFSLEELILGIGYHGPAVLGLSWHESMFTPDRDGYLHVHGPIVGGHCVCARAVDVTKQRFTVRNSWGIGWGASGDFYLSYSDMETLLQEDGEACFFEHRHTNV